MALPLSLHQNRKELGDIKFETSDEVTDQYVEYAEKLKRLVRSGFSGAVYTQTTDVEGEVNGLMTYDRKIDKVDINRVEEINKEVIETLENKLN